MGLGPSRRVVTFRFVSSTLNYSSFRQNKPFGRFDSSATLS